MTRQTADARAERRTATVVASTRTAYAQAAVTVVTTGGGGALGRVVPGVEAGHAEPVIGVPPQAARIC